MSFHLSLSPIGWVVVVVFLAGGLGLSAWLYRRSSYTLKTGTRTLLVLLRGLAFAVLGFLLLEPILSLARTSGNKPVLAVLLDASESMGIPSLKPGAKPEPYPPKILPSLLDEMGRKFEVVPYDFGDSLLPVKRSQWSQERKLWGQRTDIASALEKLSSSSGEGLPSGILLLSDGQNNYGGDPLREAQKLGIPVYAVGIGDTVPLKDLAISRVSANEIAYAGEAIPVEVVVRNQGYPQSQTSVSIREGKATLVEQSLPLPSSGTEARVNLQIPPQREGVHRFTATISVAEGELLKENNNKGFAVNVLRSKLRVSLFASPGFELRFLKAALEEDTSVTVKTYVSPSSGTWSQISGNKVSPISLTLALQGLQGSDLAILCDLPKELLSDPLQKTLLDFVDSKGGGLFILGDETLKGYSSLSLAQVLPVRLGITNLDSPVDIALTPEGETHPVTTLSQDPKQMSEMWQGLPPLLGANRVSGISSGTSVLVVYSKVKTPQGPLPVVSWQRYGKGKVLLVSGYPIWRWGFTVSGTGTGSEAYSRFLSNAVRWLGTREEGKRLKVEPVDKLVRSGERVVFSGQAYGTDNRPLDGADVSVTISEAETKKAVQNLTLISQGNGRYEGTGGPLPPGTYSYLAIGSLGTQKIGEDKGEFGVEALNLEYDQVGLNASLLKEMAKSTRGRYYDQASLGSLARDISLTAQPRKVSKELALWNHPFLFFLLLALFLAEWGVRKWVGLA